MIWIENLIVILLIIGRLYLFHFSGASFFYFPVGSFIFWQADNLKNTKYSFYFHYNKPASKAVGENRLSLHFKKTCHIVKSIYCKVDTETKNRKSQPRCVISGKAKNIEILDGVAVIT